MPKVICLGTTAYKKETGRLHEHAPGKKRFVRSRLPVYARHEVTPLANVREVASPKFWDEGCRLVKQREEAVLCTSFISSHERISARINCRFQLSGCRCYSGRGNGDIGNCSPYPVVTGFGRIVRLGLRTLKTGLELGRQQNGARRANGMACDGLDVGNRIDAGQLRQLKRV